MSPIRSSVVLSVVVVALCSSCGPEDGDGFVSSSERRISEPFTKVKVEDGLSVKIVRGPQRVTVVTDDNLIDHFVANVAGDTLTLRLKRNQNVDPTYAHVEVSSEILRELEIRNGSQVTAEATQADKWRLTISGKSTCVLTGVIADEFFLDITDKSQADVFGQVSRMDIDAGDHSRANTEGVSATDAKVEATDGSTVNVRASRQIEIRSSGDSRIFVSGSPSARNIDSDKGSQITFVTDQGE